MLKAIRAREDHAAARQKAEQLAAKLREMKLADAAGLVVAGVEETLYYYAFPREHRRCLPTNYPLDHLLREVRRRTRAVRWSIPGWQVGAGHYQRGCEVMSFRESCGGARIG